MAVNAELVREMLDIFNRSGAEAAIEFGLSPGCVWHPAPEWPGKPLYEGREGALEIVGEWTSSFDDYRWEADEIREVGDRVLTLVHHRGTSHGTRITAPVAAVWRVEAGAVVEAWFFFSWDEARRAVDPETAVADGPTGR